MIEWKINKKYEESQYELNEFLDVFYKLTKVWKEVEEIERIKLICDKWLLDLEDEEIFKIYPWSFNPISLALVRRTFPDLFANKVVGVQAMSSPVGLAYAMRVIYGGTSAQDNV